MPLVKALLTAGLALCLPAAVLAQSAGDIAIGEVEYRASCASCHGVDADGDGPVALFLRVAPPDLTALQREFGSFPADYVRQIVDGRAVVGAHGARIMPVWGTRYLEEFREFGGEQNNPALVAGRISRLVAYLGAIQEP